MAPELSLVMHRRHLAGTAFGITYLTTGPSLPSLKAPPNPRPPRPQSDQAYAEQKKWSAVRRFIGYARYGSHAAYQLLMQLCDLLRLYLNFLQPVAKLSERVRAGAEVTKHYDRARTPYQRLLAAGLLNTHHLQPPERLYLSLNPVLLREQIQQSLRQLWKMQTNPKK